MKCFENTILSILDDFFVKKLMVYTIEPDQRFAICQKSIRIRSASEDTLVKHYTAKILKVTG
uniref:Transposase n=1 Tax=Schistosoma mansoni TaxID=6183 RepID=A0A5K4F5L4_SCHMA